MAENSVKYLHPGRANSQDSNLQREGRLRVADAQGELTWKTTKARELQQDVIGNPEPETASWLTHVEF